MLYICGTSCKRLVLLLPVCASDYIALSACLKKKKLK